MEGWHWEKMKYEVFRKTILRIYIIYILKSLLRRSTYSGGELINRTEVEVRVGKLKNGKAAGNEEVTGEMNWI